MSWTDADTIKRHLQAFSVDALTVHFLPVVLEGTTALQLPHNTLAAGSVQLHMLLQLRPAGPVQLTLTGTGWHSLGYSAVLPDSVVLAPNTHPSRSFMEGQDFAVDDDTGRIRRLEGSAITDGQTVYAWLLPLTAFTEKVDYEIGYTRGTVARLPESSLPDPARVYVSYSTSASGASDTLIEQVIGETEAKIVDRLRDEYSASSTDEGLVIGATELTLASLCDDLALRALSAIGDASADDRARRFMELARRYEERAVNTLSRFLKLPLPAASTRQANPTAGSGW